MSEYKMFLVSDISGSPVLGISSGWTSDYRADGVAVSGSSVTISEVSNGFYKALVTPVPAGELTLQLENSNANYYIAPDWHEWTTTNYDNDDIYAKLLVATSSSSSLPIVSSQRFSTLNITTKDNDDIIETVQVPARYRPLTDWSNITVQAYPADRLLVSSTPPLSGTYAVNVLNATEGVIEVVIRKDVVNNIVPTGVSSATIYADVQGDDPDAYRKTVASLTISVARDFNSNI
jgi:hypothetical protein